MGLENLSAVVVDVRGGYKYILVSVINEEGKGKIVVRGDENLEMHCDILRHLKEEINECGMSVMEITCIGGGFIDVDPHKKKITINGSSGDFGVEDRNITARLLGEAFPDFKIMVTVEIEWWGDLPFDTVWR